MTAVLKRFLNVLALLSTAHLLVLLFAIVTGGVSDWNVFLGINGGILAVCYAAIVGVNYIAFGKPTLWHKKPSSEHT